MAEKRQVKVMVLKIIGALFIFSLLIIWCFNLKNLWLANDYREGAAGTSKNQEWANLRNSLSDTLNGVADQLKILEKNRNIENNTVKNNLAGKQLLANLLQETNKLVPSTTKSNLPPLASSSDGIKPASSSLVNKKQNCPTYINCMPTIGFSRPCQIPVGCEGITVIAY
ncbi:MAG: hypothetical protein WC863_03265 [Patescibacteria group bacterium]